MQALMPPRFACLQARETLRKASPAPMLCCAALRCSASPLINDAPKAIPPYTLRVLLLSLRGWQPCRPAPHAPAPAPHLMSQKEKSASAAHAPPPIR